MLAEQHMESDPPQSEDPELVLRRGRIDANTSTLHEDRNGLESLFLELADASRGIVNLPVFSCLAACTLARNERATWIKFLSEIGSSCELESFVNHDVGLIPKLRPALDESASRWAMARCLLEPDASRGMDPAIDTSEGKKSILLDFLDGYVTVFYFDPGPNPSWTVWPVRGEITSSCPDVELIEKLSPYFGGEENIRRKFLLYSTRRIKNWETFSKIRLLRRLPLSRSVSNALHLDLSLDRLAIGISLRGKVFWRYLPSWGLSSWLEIIGGSSHLNAVFIRAILDVLRDNGPTDRQVDGMAWTKLSPEMIRAGDYCKSLRLLFPEGLSMLCTGWLSSQVFVDALSNTFAGSCKELFFSTPENGLLSVWQHFLPLD